MRHFLETILAITAQAEKIPRRYFRRTMQVSHKQDQSPVTVADQATEKFIRDALTARFPDHAILGEEFGTSGGTSDGTSDGDSEFQWVIDPIDGTRSFISGMPLYGMLIALLKGDTPVLGVVRMPELQEVYTGSDAGAFLNGRALKVSGVTSLADAFIYINEADKIQSTEPEIFQRLIVAGHDRRFGYDCYPHMLVAAGHADACVDYDLKPYDFLPLSAVVQGAGGLISDWQGNRLGMASDGRVVSAATPALHQQLLDVLNQT